MTISMKMTAKQFLQLGPDPQGVRLELVHGDIVVSPGPSPKHSYVDRYLGNLIMNHILEHDLGEMLGDVDTIFDEDDVRRPDIIFTAKARLHLLPDEEHGISIAPDLCVEILSPSSVAYDQGDKFELYAASGVPYYWLVNPMERTFVAYKLVKKRYVQIAAGREDELVSAEPFPGLEIPLSKIWRPKRGQ